MGIIMLSSKVWEKTDYRNYMYYKNMVLFHLCHSCLEAYRSGRKYFILCVTSSSEEDAIFSVMHFSYFIDNCTCFFQWFLVPRFWYKKFFAVLCELPWNPQFIYPQHAWIFYILYHIFFIINLFLSPVKVLAKHSNLTI